MKLQSTFISLSPIKLSNCFWQEKADSRYVEWTSMMRPWKATVSRKRVARQTGSPEENEVSIGQRAVQGRGNSAGVSCSNPAHSRLAFGQFPEDGLWALEIFSLKRMLQACDRAPTKTLDTKAPMSFSSGQHFASADTSLLSYGMHLCSCTERIPGRLHLVSPRLLPHVPCSFHDFNMYLSTVINHNPLV